MRWLLLETYGVYPEGSILNDDNNVEAQVLEEIRQAEIPLVAINSKVDRYYTTILESSHVPRVFLTDTVTVVEGRSEDSIPIEIGDGGVPRLYVNPAGSDSAPGTIFEPLASVQKACDRLSVWLANNPGYNGDVVINLSGSVFSESVYFAPPNLSSRLIFDGNRTAMTVLSTGTTTAGSAYLITDAGAAFGTSMELMGYPAAVWDPADEVGTKQWTTVRWHNNTSWEPAQEFLGATNPGAGWTYAIYRPATRIVAPTDQQPAFRMSLPGAFPGFASGHALGQVIFRWIEFERDAPVLNPYEPVVQISGGRAQLTGCVIRGAGLGIELGHGDAILAGPYSWENADPILGFDNPFDFTFYGCTAGIIITAGGYMGIYSQDSNLAATVVINSVAHGLWVEGGFATVLGAIHNGDLVASWGGTINIGALPTFPMRINDHHQGCVNAERFGHIDVFSAWLESVERSGFMASNGGSINLFGTVTVGAVGIGRWGIDCRDNGAVIVSEETLADPFTGTLGTIALDGAEYTWADLTARSPLLGARSGSRVSHAVDVEEIPPYAEFGVEADGAHHIYVDAAGDDINDGTAGRPVATVQHACHRVERLLSSGPPNHDIVVHMDGDVFTEAVTFRPPVMPRRRVIFQGDRAAMTVVVTGTSTAGSATTITDAGAAFAANALVGYPIKVFNPADEAGTFSWTTVAAHTDKVITFSGGLDFATIPAAGWTYTVYRPATRIDATGLGPAFDIEIPQAGIPASGVSEDEASAWVAGGNGIIFRWIEFTRGGADTYDLTTVKVSGGTLVFSGCVISGGPRSLYALDATIYAGYLFPAAAADPVLGFGGYEYSTWTCTLGIRRTLGGIGTIWVERSKFSGFLAILTTSHGFWALDSNVQINDGAITGGEIAILQGGFARISSLLLKDTPVNQPGLKLGNETFWGGAHAEVYNMRFDGCLRDGISVYSMSTLQICEGAVAGGVQTLSGGIAGWALTVDNGSRVSLGDGTCTALTATSGQITVDGAAEVLFANLTVGSPAVGPNSGARVWREPPA